MGILCILKCLVQDNTKFHRKLEQKLNCQAVNSLIQLRLALATTEFRNKVKQHQWILAREVT
jgi:hypothetical protein